MTREILSLSASKVSDQVGRMLGFYAGFAGTAPMGRTSSINIPIQQSGKSEISAEKSGTVVPLGDNVNDDVRLIKPIKLNKCLPMDCDLIKSTSEKKTNKKQHLWLQRLCESVSFSNLLFLR